MNKVRLRVRFYNYFAGPVNFSEIYRQIFLVLVDNLHGINIFFALPLKIETMTFMVNCQYATVYISWDEKSKTLKSPYLKKNDAQFQKKIILFLQFSSSALTVIHN